jgi:hypothetical protein
MTGPLRIVSVSFFIDHHDCLGAFTRGEIRSLSLLLNRVSLSSCTLKRKDRAWSSSWPLCSLTLANVKQVGVDRKPGRDLAIQPIGLCAPRHCRPALYDFRNSIPSQAMSSGVCARSLQMEAAEESSPRANPKLSIVSQRSY